MVKEVTTEELKQKIAQNEKFYLIDARSKDDFQHNHLPEAVNLAWGPEFEQEMSAVLPDKDAKVIVYGTNEACVMAKNAVEHLESAGYENIVLYTPGIMGWMESGLQLEFGKSS